MQGVLVTGASTGIGHATALRLAQRFVVFAGVRREADRQRLASARRNIRPLPLDVTNAADIAAAAETVSRSGIPLHGVVNNAGIAVAGPLEFVALDRMREQFDINVLGALAVTQAMLPHLRRTNGRIIFVSSVSGRIAPPFLGPYAASKFALEALGDSLRMELARFGIAVSVVQPGNVKTPIWQKGGEALRRDISQMPREAWTSYGDVLERLGEVTQREERSGIDADVVATAIERALTDARPRARYAVGSPPAWQRSIASILPERLRDRLILKSFRR